MQVVNHVNPTAAQLHSLAEQAPDGAIHMLNLLKFRETADYGGRAERPVTGREAYMRYGAEVSKLVDALGGRMIYVGEPKALVIGEVEAMWDLVAIAEYPSAAAFVKMATSPEMAAISHHRTAGLEGQLLILLPAGGAAGG